MKKMKRGEKGYTYTMEMVFNREIHEVLLQKRFMQLIQENPEIKTPMLYLTNPRYLPFLHKKKMYRREKKIYVQVGNGLKRKNYEVLLQKKFMQLIQENPEIKTPMLYFTDPWCLPFLLMKNM